METENQILMHALQAFEEVTATAAVVVKRELALPQGRADAEVRFGKEKPILVEVKRNVRADNVGLIVAQLKRFHRPVILVTRYLTPPMAERLKELDIPFMDTVGNAYMRTPRIFVYVAGRKPAEKARNEKPVRAFRATGLKVIFGLLCLPDLAAKPYREIAGKTGVALGTVNHVIRDLEHLGYLRETRAQGRALENKPKLIDAWVDAYQRELRPRLKPLRFRVAKGDWWKTENLKELDIWLGGEPGAALAAGHLHPEIATVYGATQFKTLAARIHPVKDDFGNLELLEKFWNFEIPQPVKGRFLAPPLLIYADLVRTADPRNFDAARLIRERFLA